MTFVWDNGMSARRLAQRPKARSSADVKRLVACALLVLAACAAPAALRERHSQSLPLAGGGRLTITTTKDAPIPGRVKFLADVAWRHYCGTYANVHCDLARSYAMLVFSIAPHRCSVTVWGEQIADDKAIVRRQASYVCIGGAPDPNEPLFPEGSVIYGADDPTPIVELDGPMWIMAQTHLQTLPIPVTVLDPRDFEMPTASTTPPGRH